MNIREQLNKKPWLGWTLAGVLFAVMIFMFVRGGRGGESPYSPERMTESVTIRFADTGDEMTITRGNMDKMLRERGASLDPNEGIINPKTGKPTGFLFNKKEWDEWITRINAEKAAARNNAGKVVAPAPRETRQLSEEEIKALKEQAEKAEQAPRGANASPSTTPATASPSPSPK